MSDAPLADSTQSPPPRSKRSKIITWAILVVLNIIIFVFALTRKSASDAFIAIYVLFGLGSILIGIVMFVIGLFKKKLRRYWMLIPAGILFIGMGVVVQVVNPAPRDTGTNIDQGVKVNTGLPSATPKPATARPSPSPGDNLTEILGRSAKISSARFEIVTSVSGQSSATGKMWVKGNKIRAEENTGGQSLVYIEDGNIQTLYTYSPAKKYATKELISAETNDIGDLSPGGVAKKILKEKPVVVGSGKIDGKDSVVVEATGKTVKNTKPGYGRSTDSPSGQKLPPLKIDGLLNGRI